MLAWLMPLIISIGISIGCPEPGSVRCGGVPCQPDQSHSSSSSPSSPLCCQDSCGTYTYLDQSQRSASINQSQRSIVHQSLHALRTPQRRVGRLKRETLQSSECDGSSNETKIHGCSVCVCRSRVWMCETKNCQSCQLKASNTDNTRTDTMYEHGETFEAGCSTCWCNDGLFECDHSRCKPCYYKTNQTVSGDSTRFRCGMQCQCYNGDWNCQPGTCQSTAHRGQPSLLLLLIIPSLLLMVLHTL